MFSWLALVKQVLLDRRTNWSNNKILEDKKKEKYGLVKMLQ